MTTAGNSFEIHSVEIKSEICTSLSHKYTAAPAKAPIIFGYRHNKSIVDLRIAAVGQPSQDREVVPVTVYCQQVSDGIEILLMPK